MWLIVNRDCKHSTHLQSENYYGLCNELYCLRNVRIKEALEEENLPKIYQGGTKNFDKTLFIYFQRLIFFLGKFFFVVIYYYFMPFTTVVLSQQLGGKPSQEYID